MWNKIKPWVLGSDKDSEKQNQLDNLYKSSLSDNKNKASSEDIARVETRSRRRISPASKGASESSTGSRPEESSQVKDKRPAKAARVYEPEILASTTLQSVVPLDDLLTTQPRHMDTGSAQSLPHRSRSSAQLEDEAQPTRETLPDFVIMDQVGDSYEETGQSHGDAAIEVMEDAAMIKQTGQTTIEGVESNSGREDLVISELTGENNAKRRRTRKSKTSSKEAHSASVSNHKRFGSEDPAPDPQIQQTHVEDLRTTIQSEIVDDESEDDAPEELTAITAAQEAKVSAAKTAQSIKIQKEADRAKRQRKDLALKTQAQASKKRKVKSSPQEDLDKALPTETSPAQTSHNHMEDLPDELPEEILALEPEPSATLLNVKPRRRERPNKRKRLNQDLKPAKDVRIGNTNIRVLPSTNTSLPPPAGRRANNVKEAWLRARIKESKGKASGFQIKGAGARSFLCRSD